MKLKKITVVFLIFFAFALWYGLLAPYLGLPEIPKLAQISSLFGFIFAFLHAGIREGWKRAGILLGLIFVISLLFESVGVLTGWVYGHYHYSEKLGYRIFDLVPAIIPIAWFMMMYPSYVIADILTPSHWSRAKRIIPFATIGGFAMTAWDVVMDPIMSQAGNWIWERGGPYYDIPLQNFWGWWLTVFVAFALYLWLTKREPKEISPAFDRLALTSYALMGFANVFVAIKTGLGGAGLAGFFAMTPWLLMAWFSTEKSASS